MKNLKIEKEIIRNWNSDISRPLVSICCLTYNHEKYIEDALKGFLIQKTDFPFEILIHDDASTDKTADIIRDYETRYPNLIKPIYQKQNQYSQGKKPNQEFNFPRAKGKYIALNEGDDYWTDPAKLRIQIDFMRSHHNCVMCFHRSSIWHYKDDEVTITTSKNFPDIDIWPRSSLFLEGGSTAPSASILYNKSALSELPAWYHLSPVGDMAIKLLLFLRGDIGFIDRVMAVRRLGTPGSWNVITRLNIERQNQYLIKMIAMLKSFNKATNSEWANDVYKKIILYELQKNSFGLSPIINIRKEYPDYFKDLSFYQKFKLLKREWKINSQKALSPRIPRNYVSCWADSNINSLITGSPAYHLNDILYSSAEYALNVQALDGSFPAGHNGPYQDPETPVRNTAHWLFLLASLYEKSMEEKWKKGGEKAIAYLMSSAARPHGKTFYCRNKKEKDKCNGLIGQAWVIEALVKASKAFDRQDCYELAETVFMLHPWDKNIGIWQRVEIDGSPLSYDGTFNHQLWFAAAGSQLDRTPEAKIRVDRFMEKIAYRVQLYRNGVIFHSSAMGRLHSYLKNGLKPFLQELKSRLEKRSLRKGLFSKSAGYHGFNVYAFAMLKKIFPDAKIWNSDTFKALITAHRNDGFVSDVKNSEFGYRYNISGIEIAFAVETFFQDTQEVTTWINRQLKETYLDDGHPLSRNVFDPNTADARIYQAARFSENYNVFKCWNSPDSSDRCNLKAS